MGAKQSTTARKCPSPYIHHLTKQTKIFVIQFDGANPMKVRANQTNGIEIWAWRRADIEHDFEPKINRVDMNIVKKWHPKSIKGIFIGRDMGSFCDENGHSILFLLKSGLYVLVTGRKVFSFKTKLREPIVEFYGEPYPVFVTKNFIGVYESGKTITWKLRSEQKGDTHITEMTQIYKT